MIEFNYFVSVARRTLMLAAVLAASCCGLCAQADGAGAGQMHPRGGNPERELRELTRVLTLNEDQQGQVKMVLGERRQKMEALRASGTQPTREQMMAIHKESNAKITELLNEDQKAKFAAWQQQRMQWRHGAGGEGAPATAPPGA
jgi:Spy/CpxP family protein refolding chaperone